jgi:hypothetical protein
MSSVGRSEIEAFLSDLECRTRNLARGRSPRRISGDLHGSEEGTAWDWFAPSKLPDELLGYAVVWLSDAFANDAAVRVR